VSNSIISVVVPCYNEQEVIPETHRRISSVLSGINGFDFEIIYVDDGSSDLTASILRDIQAIDPNVRLVLLSRNFGHQMAVSAGIEHSTGDVVVLMDADLQDPPELICEMLERWKAGVKVVYGVRTEREGEGEIKRLTASGFYRFINYISEVSIPIDTGDFRLMDREVVEALKGMPERDRFLRGMISWVGFRQEPVYYKRAPRFAGASKYPIRKMVRFAFDGIISFSQIPLRVATWIGLAASGLSLLGIMYALYVRLFTDAWVAGWTFVVISILFVGGVQLLCLGVIGEYVGRIYGESKKRPLYVVSGRLGFQDKDVAGEYPRK
jgi:dolichol-phosphate mannosyltransferase